jgi:2-polyprenyl-6-methoxyphenol hydroxylase-like FAD-dependent oxidoreductase
MTDSAAYDAIVVGARCAGAPTAMLLARHGHRVLLVDRSTFPSDTLSTLVIQPHGVAALDRWGLLDEVRATGCPPMGRYVFDFGPAVVSGRPRPVDGHATPIAPRRTVLDKILVDAAARAGAEVREGFTVDEVITDDGAVVGIRGHADGGREVVERARVVIGADGHNSRIARAVGAERYREKPVLENAFYSFWCDLPVDAFTTVIRGDRAFAAIPTNDDATLLLVGCPFAQASEFRRDVEANYREAISRDPEWSERLAAATRVDRFTGGGVPNFFRKPYGPGWALVGDAGYTKDPVTAQGIANAFLSAEQVASNLTAVWGGECSFEEAMGRYQVERDRAVLPMYEFTTQLATLEPPPPDMQELLVAVAGHQPAMDAFVSVNAGTMSPEEFFDPDHLAGLFAPAGDRGNVPAAGKEVAAR